MKVGCIVRPRTQAGLQLGTVPTTGIHEQEREVAFVLRGWGTVVEVRDIVIDYDTWPELYEGLGEVPYRNCLVETPDGRQGWAGAGALVRDTAPGGLE